LLAEADLPRNCCYGDGQPIADAAMDHILDTYQRLEIVFRWETNDILMLDNIAVAHGRNPYRGERQLLVALGSMTTWDDAARGVATAGAAVCHAGGHHIHV
jgi:hypothetical protein